MKTYADENVLRNADVEIRTIYLQQPGQPGPEPIAPFDLVRIDLYGTDALEKNITLIQRVGADGTVTLPAIGAVNIARMADDAASMAVRKKLRPNSSAVITTIEPAPPDAAARALPAGPVDPVPDPLRPVFSQ